MRARGGDKLYGDDIAFAMEMLSEGYYPHHIAAAMGVSAQALADAIERGERDGYRPRQKKQYTKAVTNYVQAKAMQAMDGGDSGLANAKRARRTLAQGTGTPTGLDSQHGQEHQRA